MNRIAKVLKINRKTVARKLQFLGEEAKRRNLKQLAALPLAEEFQFDDLETSEHTKLKPVSVKAVVEKGSRRVLWFEVAQMPAKGKIAKLSRKKYGYRKDKRPEAAHRLFKTIQNHVSPSPKITTDQDPRYTKFVRRYFPKAEHETVKGRRACVVGQGELKAGGFDPLFSLNHTFAMFRDNLNRLTRRTWATTKKLECLTHHLHIYVWYHNNQLIQLS